MSEFSGTPGPWKWFTSNSHMRLSSLTTGRDGDVVAAYKAADGMAVVNVKKADADLIAAAPDLLDALQDMLEKLKEEGMQSGTWLGPICHRSALAINKALGVSDE